ncbi:MAG: peptide chain release factor-like protein [Dehalococcoidia bacterium]
MASTPDEADYLRLSDEDLLRQCRVDTFRASGPGGQHRNKTDTAVRLTHQPTGCRAQASERRSQQQNRRRALARLRQTIALDVRRPLDLNEYTPPPELDAILPLAKRDRVGPKHRDYWLGIQALLDLFVAVDCAVSKTAERAGMSTGALSRFLLADSRLLRKVNQLRADRDMRPLR